MDRSWVEAQPRDWQQRLAGQWVLAAHVLAGAQPIASGGARDPRETARNLVARNRFAPAHGAVRSATPSPVQQGAAVSS
jgi:hypothetical protein